jgi:hypothetical protein
MENGKWKSNAEYQYLFIVFRIDAKSQYQYQKQAMINTYDTILPSVLKHSIC